MWKAPETSNSHLSDSGGRCHYDDGGWYAGNWESGMAHGHGICGSGPRAKEVTEFSGLWQQGFEANGVCRWANGTTYEGQWLQGKQHGLGVERVGHWIYQGEWTHGSKGRYGACKSLYSNLRYEGSWTSGVKDGYGVETYPDEGTYHGQWMRGMRHGYGVRQSAPYTTTLRTQMTNFQAPASTQMPYALSFDRDYRIEESRGGFVLQTKATTAAEVQTKVKKTGLLDRLGKQGLRKSLANELKIIRQKSTGDLNHGGQSSGVSSRASSTGGSVRSNTSAFSQISSAFSGTSTSEDPDDEVGSFCIDMSLTDDRVTERYAGEWKNDKRSGFGVCERSDGVKYEGEWLNNRKHGYGVTSLNAGIRLEGKYKSNVLVSPWKSSKLFSLRSNKIRDKIEASVSAAQKAANMAIEKMETANVRMTSARVRADQADEAAKRAIGEADIAAKVASQYSQESRGARIIANRQQSSEVIPSHTDKITNRLVPPNQPQVNIQEPKQHKKFTFFKRKGESSWRSKSESRKPQLPPFSLFGNSSLKSNQNSTATPPDFVKYTNYNQSYESPANAISSSNHVGQRDFDDVYSSHPKGNPVNDTGVAMSLNVPLNVWSSNVDKISNSAQRIQGVPASPSKSNEDGGFTLFRDSIYNFASQQKQGDVNGAAVHSEWGGGAGRLPGFTRSAEVAHDRNFTGKGSYTVESVEADTVVCAWQVEGVREMEQKLFRNESSATNAYGQNSTCSRPPTNFSIGRNAPCPNSNSKLFKNERDIFEPLADRRKSLPSILKGAPAADSAQTSESPSRSLQVSSSSPPKTLLGQTQLSAFSTGSRAVHPADNVPTDTFVIENGVRKRLKPRPVVAAAASRMADVPRYDLEASRTPYKRGDLGSLPDVSSISDSEILPREIVYELSQRRREELMRQREEMEKRYGANIVFRIEDILEWLWAKKLFVVVCVLNLALLYAFLNLLK